VSHLSTTSKLLKPVVALLAAVTLVCVAVAGTSTAAPSARGGVGQVKKLVAKQIAKAAPTLSVARAKTADSATTAATAATASNAQAVGGRSLAQLQTVLDGATSTSVVNDIGTGGTDVVTLAYTLAAPSRVNFSGVVELGGDNSSGVTATCVIRNDGSLVSAAFETTFDDIGTNANNPASDVVLSSVGTVPAGAHVATLHCSRSASAVSKDDAAINIVAVPN
jgi:hypothetical protein